MSTWSILLKTVARVPYIAPVRYMEPSSNLISKESTLTKKIYPQICRPNDLVPSSEFFDKRLPF